MRDRGLATRPWLASSLATGACAPAREDATSRAAERLLGRCIASRARPQHVPHRAWDSRPVLI
jgi:hypothetical protein